MIMYAISVHCTICTTAAGEGMYTQFSPLGIVLTPDVDPDQSNLHRYGSMPVFHHMSDLPGGYVLCANLLFCSLFTPPGSDSVLLQDHVCKNLILFQGR